MIPNVFISSTIMDLHHLRDSIRDVIFEIGYNPIMSDYGDIGYLPTDTAEDSCYLAMKDCQIAIIIISKRYGYISSNGNSVTHNEFRTARRERIPVIFLIEEEIMAFKKVFDANQSVQSITLPSMDNPTKTFELIREFTDSENNNGLLTYTNVQSAKSTVKRQLAHIMGDMLRKAFDPIGSEVKDILSEITTLRQFLVKKERSVAKEFAHIYRQLLDPNNHHLAYTVEVYSKSLEDGVYDIQDCSTFEDYLIKKHIGIEIRSSIELKTMMEDSNNADDILSSFWADPTAYDTLNDQFDKYKTDGDIYVAVSGATFFCNRNGLDHMNVLYKRVKVDSANILSSGPKHRRGRPPKRG